MKLYEYFLSIALVVSIQFTDYKIYDIKLGDIISIIFMVCFLFMSKKIITPKFYKQLLVIFLIFLLNSIIASLYIKFSIPENISFLKRPVILSCCRYIQCTGCIFFSLFTFNLFNKESKDLDKNIFIFIDRTMILLSIVFLLAFLLSHMGIETPFVCEKKRLRGGYVEGGPFGLFISFYIIMRYLVIKKNDIYTILFFLQIILSQSKAAIIFLPIFYIIYLVIEKKLNVSKIVILFIFSTIILFIINSYFNFSDKLLKYWIEYFDIYNQIYGLNRENDSSLVMGRIAALHIAPNIILDNPIIGVGMGNYSLVRNNEEYLQRLPPVSEWDLSGLGGVFNTIIESGFLGLILLISPFIYLWIKFNNCNIVKYGIILFFLPQVLGVQLYFHYIWFGLCLFYYLGIKENVSK